MTETAIFAEENNTLKETALRLIEAMGAEMAIFICRSNYWHGVLKIVEELDLAAKSQPRPSQTTATVHRLPPPEAASRGTPSAPRDRCRRLVV